MEKYEKYLDMVYMYLHVHVEAKGTDIFLTVCNLITTLCA